MPYIYKIINTLNQDFYIGKTVQSIADRYRKHKRKAKVGTSHLYKSMRKYGVENFVIEAIEECVADIINDREIFFISKLRPRYNETPGGDGGDTSHTEGYKLGMKNRKSFKGENNPMYGTDGGMFGKSHTEETKLKQSIARKKFWKDENNKKNISIKVSGSNNGMYGKRPANAKIVIYEGKTYSSLKDACETTKLSPKTLKKLGAIIL